MQKQIQNVVTYEFSRGRFNFENIGESLRLKFQRIV